MGCKHKRRVPIEMIVKEGCQIAGTDIVGDVEKKIYYCRDCRVLFLPIESEKIVNLHEEKRKK
jgi:hypothetical protein